MSKQRKMFIPVGGSPRLVGRPDPAVYAAMGEENIFAMLVEM